MYKCTCKYYIWMCVSLKFWNIMPTHTDKNLESLAQMLDFTVEENYGFFFLAFKIKLVWIAGMALIMR